MDNEEIRKLLQELKKTSDESTAVRSKVVKIHFDTPEEAERRRRIKRRAEEEEARKQLEEADASVIQARRDYDEKLAEMRDMESRQKLLDEMGRDGVTLEESFACYEKGIRLLRQVNERIDRVEKKVQMLTEDGTLEAFE